MNRIKFLIVALLAGVMLAGCADTGDVKDYVTARNTCTGTMAALTPMVQMGVFDASTTKSIVKIFDDANAVFAAWRTVLDANGTSVALNQQVDILIQRAIDYEMAAIADKKAKVQ